MGYTRAENDFEGFDAPDAGIKVLLGGRKL